MSESPAVVHSDAVEWENVGEGIRRQVLAYGPDLMIVRVDFKSGGVGSIHHHPHRQATYVARGTFEATLGLKTVTLREGDSFFAAEDVPHGVVALEDGTLIDTFTPAREDFVPKH
jgi:Uncharacterized conserved protein, contains double-stranded beta-helix domain